jgi:TP901 family phage tail tape measure protein
MAARDMVMQVVLRLRDDLGGKLNGVLGKIRSWGGRAVGIFAGVGRAIGAISDRLGALGLVMTGGFAAGLRSLTAFDSSVRDTAIILGKAGDDAERWIKRTETWAQATAKAVGQRSQDIVGAQNALIGAGLPEDASTTMVPQIAKVATAANAALEDMTTTSKALFQSFGVGADRMEAALAKLYEAGRLGAFELKSMAQYLPELAPLMASMGSKGEGAVGRIGALLQISQMGAGDPATAANNFKNFLSQSTGPAFNKRMEEAGIDMPKVLQDAAAKGIDPVEATLAKVIKATNAGSAADKAVAEAKKRGLSEGDTEQLVRERVTSAIEASKLGELFPDMQSKTFLATYLLHRDEYKSLRDQINAAGLDATNDAFATRMAGPERQQQSAFEQFEQAMRRMSEVTTTAITAFGWVGEKLNGMISALDGVSPKIIDLGSAILQTISLLAAGRTALNLAGFPGGAQNPATKPAAAAAGGLLAGLFRAVGVPLLGGWLTAEALDYTDPKGNLWGGTSSIDAWMLKHWGFDPSKKGDEDGSFQKWLSSASNPSPSTAAPGYNAYGTAKPTPGYNPYAPAAKTEVGGQITVKVEGPGAVTSTTSTNPAVPIVTDRGVNGGRP